MGIRGVLFDLDGVLVDAKEWHYEALNRALSTYGFAISRYDHLVTYDGLPTSRKLEILSRDRGLPRELHPHLSELKQKYTREMIQHLCRPVFQRESALARLKQEGYRLAVCSNSTRPSVESMLRASHLLPHVEFFLSNQDVGKPKPDPEIYSRAMERLGLAPQECLIIEDNEHGICAARAAGARVMVVEGVADVTYENIHAQIQKFDAESTVGTPYSPDAKHVGTPC